MIRCSATSPPSWVKFNDAAQKGNLIPLYESTFSDDLTPVLAYRRLVKEDDKEAPSFLFESVNTGLEHTSIGRYSVIGAQPAMEIVAKENLVTIIDHLKDEEIETHENNPMDTPRRLMEKWKPQSLDGLPHAFTGICLWKLNIPCASSKGYIYSLLLLYI